MAKVVFNHFGEVLGHQSPRTIHLDYVRLGIPQVELPGMDYCFCEEEVWRTMQDMPLDKAPGLTASSDFSTERHGPSSSRMLCAHSMPSGLSMVAACIC